MAGAVAFLILVFICGIDTDDCHDNAYDSYDDTYDIHDNSNPHYVRKAPFL